MIYNTTQESYAENMQKVFRLFYWRQLVICLVLVGVLWLARTLTGQLGLVMPKQLQDLVTFAASILIESLPFVLLGVILSIVVQVWLPAGTLTRWLPKQGILRRLYISCFGVFFPVCECGNLPLARGLVARGFTPAESLTFLLAAPVLNPITLVTTYQAFPSDIRILIARALGVLLIANFIGWLFSKHPKQESILTPEFAATCKRPISEPHEHGHTKLLHSLRFFSKELRILLPALFVGAAIAGAIQVLVPREILLSIGTNPILSICAMLVLAFVVAICSNVDAFFALAFSNTFSVGSIVSFLVFGPLIDIKMLTLMRTTYTTKVLVQVTLLVTLLSFAIGLGVNYAF
jgi:uncharacterized membrane protein YraQ (UPF0718 family)